MNRKKISYGTKLPVVLSLNERDIVRDETFCDPDFGRIGVIEGTKIKLMMTLDEIDDILGHIASVTNHARNGKLRKELDKVYDKLEKIMDRYEEEDLE